MKEQFIILSIFLRFLISYVGKLFEVSETKDLIYIDKSFADEYAGSVYTQKLRGALPKVKANMSQGIPEMIEIATEKRWKEDFQGKHKKRAGKGWFRYNTRFALPVVNEKGDILEYNVYQAVLIVRYSSDEKLYLYDIQNIKKETRYPSCPRWSETRFLSLIIKCYIIINERKRVSDHLGQDRQMVRNPFPFINYNITFY